jgi:hypothetical protein
MPDPAAPPAPVVDPGDVAATVALPDLERARQLVAEADKAKREAEVREAVERSTRKALDPDAPIDLDKLRARRREGRQAAIPLVVDGKRYELPAELPLTVLDSLAALGPAGATSAADPNANPEELLEGMRGILDDLLGADTAKALVREHRLTMDDLLELIDELLARYGFEDGLPPS